MTKLKRTVKDLIKSCLPGNRMTVAERYMRGVQTLEEVERRHRELSRQGF